MAVANFIPTVWAGRLLSALQKALVYGQTGVVNTDYEGEITDFGDSVKINTIGDPTIKDYTRNSDIDTPEELNSAQELLLIDVAKYFNFAVDDVDQAQMRPQVMDEAMTRSGYKLRDVADQYIANRMYPAVSAASTITDPTISTAADIYVQLVNLAVKLDEANVPAENRWVIVPPWFHGGLLKDDRFVRGFQSGETILKNALVGQAAGFTVMRSNNVPLVSTKYKIIGGTGMAFSWAQQILKMEAFRPERRFSDAIKGLHVYGGKVVRPEGLAMITMARPAGF